MSSGSNLATTAVTGTDSRGSSSATDTLVVGSTAFSTSGETGGLAGTSTGAPESGASGTAGASGACYPAGIFGPCHTGCQCLQGANVSQFCTASCDSAADGGDASDFPGATPICAPINPGAADMICALMRAASRDCPSCMFCTASGVANTNICAELQ